jgi:hypothetical protein
MRIIYDTEKPARERVTIDGSDAIIGCYKIELEVCQSGQAGLAITYSRWGSIKERKEKHKAVWEEAQKAKATQELRDGN